MSAATDVVDRQIAAFRARDIEAFLACYAPDAKIRDFDGNVLADGHDGMRAQYVPVFDGSPNLAVDVPRRVEAADFVVDEEHITGFMVPGFPESMQAGTVYRVRNGLISDVMFLM